MFGPFFQNVIFLGLTLLGLTLLLLLATWEVRDLLLIPSFMFSESAIIKRPPLSSTARRAVWVGCNIDLHRIAPEARIPIIAASLPTDPAQVRARYTRLKPIREIKTPKTFGAGPSTR